MPSLFAMAFALSAFLATLLALPTSPRLSAALRNFFATLNTPTPTGTARATTAIPTAAQDSRRTRSGSATAGRSGGRGPGPGTRTAPRPGHTAWVARAIAPAESVTARLGPGGSSGGVGFVE